MNTWANAAPERTATIEQIGFSICRRGLNSVKRLMSYRSRLYAIGS